MNRTVAFGDAVRGEARALKLTVDVAGEDKCAMLYARRPAFEHGKASMRFYLAIETQTMSIEPPRERRIFVKGAGVGSGANGDGGIG